MLKDHKNFSFTGGKRQEIRITKIRVANAEGEELVEYRVEEDQDTAQQLRESLK